MLEPPTKHHVEPVVKQVDAEDWRPYKAGVFPLAPVAEPATRAPRPLDAARRSERNDVRAIGPDGRPGAALSLVVDARRGGLGVEVELSVRGAATATSKRGGRLPVFCLVDDTACARYVNALADRVCHLAATAYDCARTPGQLTDASVDADLAEFLKFKATFHAPTNLRPRPGKLGYIPELHGPQAGY